MTSSDTVRVPLPRSVEEIDVAWLAAALKEYAPRSQLVRCEIGEVIHGTCTKVRLKVEFDATGDDPGIPAQLVLKTGLEPHSPQLPFMHEAEVRAYRDVLPVLRLRSPACYFAQFDKVSGRGAVIMEDLSMRGVDFCDPLRPQAPEAVAQRIGALAAFHAQTWDSADFADGGRWDWVPVTVPEGGGHMAQFLQPAVWQSFIELPRGRAASIYFQDRTWMQASLDRMARLGASRPHAVLHGDTHLGNLYVDTDGAPGFFDSLPHRWPGIAEIAYHVAGALDPIDRRAAERDLIAHYLQELDASGIPVQSLDQTMADYAAFLAFGFMIFVTNSSEFQPEAINTAYTSRFSAAMIDNNTIDALAAI